MPKKSLMLCLGLALILGLTGSAAAVTVDIYSGFGNAGGGAPYSGLVGSFTSPDIRFATDTGYAWHPFGMSSFGAKITGGLAIPADGLYVFALNSDDGSMLYINDHLVIDNGGAHGPQLMFSAFIFLHAGCNPFRVEFYEDFGGPSGVDLHLPLGVGYCPVPLPPAFLLLGSGLLGLVGLRRFRKN
jgi:hypothetical protein